VSRRGLASVSGRRPLQGLVFDLWFFSPERLWAFSRTLHRREHHMLAFCVKQLNTLLYHNSLSPGATVGSDVLLGHYSHGIVVNSNVEIGDGVKIWHNVTLTAGRMARLNGKRIAGPESRIVIEDAVKIGANAVVIAPRGECLRIGRGARIGAGVVVTQDIPARATVVSPPAQIHLRDAPAPDADAEGSAADVLFSGSSDAVAEHAPVVDEDTSARRRASASQQP
jgi:serine O-acetyltransferase